MSIWAQIWASRRAILGLPSIWALDKHKYGLLDGLIYGPCRWAFLMRSIWVVVGESLDEVSF